MHGCPGKPSLAGGAALRSLKATLAMFSVPDILVVSILALLLFGPDRLPKLMRQAGRFMREVQNTSQSFIAEMERAADTSEPPFSPPPPHIESEAELLEHGPDGEATSDSEAPRRPSIDAPDTPF